ncbi:uncharacterized protein HD556DRAFT_1314890 [Suillus plorans]|uniref:Uncharacterized protein n=1 Tax=Suillus plorans TaxID=116603 RepID=A0A9P7AAL9_9AGAM|nr:uncharacterized protein HD556DRAFT_1314890 [Suillus plorans]KAG1784677.1 hypothetical protein HD556DRAFT_1314890 [Suillus plorans]
MDVYKINIKKSQIDGFTQSALMHLREGFDTDDDPDNLNIDILDDLDDDLDDFTETSDDIWTNSPELTVIPLPSNLGVMSVQQVVSLHASIYTKTWKQMMKLEPRKDQLEKYKHLLRDQLKISTAVRDPNARGQRNKSLAWFWSVEVELGGPNQLWNEECHASYSGRQSRMYSLLAQDAQAAFQDLQTMLIDALDESLGNWPVGGFKQQCSFFGSDHALQSQVAMGDNYFCDTDPALLSCKEHHFGDSQASRSYSSVGSRAHVEYGSGPHLFIPPMVMGLRWIREHLLTLLEEPQAGICDKMTEMQMYATILDRLKIGKGEQP